MMIDFMELHRMVYPYEDNTTETVYVNVSEIISIEKAKNDYKGCLIHMKDGALFYIMDSLEHTINRLKISPRVHALEYAKV